MITIEVSFILKKSRKKIDLSPTIVVLLLWKFFKYSDKYSDNFTYTYIYINIILGLLILAAIILSGYFSLRLFQLEHKKVSFIFFGVSILSTLAFGFVFFKLDNYDRYLISLFLLKLLGIGVILENVLDLIENSRFFKVENNKILYNCKYFIVKQLIKNYNSSLCKRILKFIGINGLDLRKVEIPKEYDFFQNFSPKTLSNVSFPPLDVTFYNWKFIYFKNVNFSLPIDITNLQSFVDACLELKLRSVENSLSFPNADYSSVDFSGHSLSRVSFHEDSILPEDINLFQKIKSKNLYKTKLPNHCIKNIHLYNLNNVHINLKDYKCILNNEQIAIIHKKYHNQINDNIIF